MEIGNTSLIDHQDTYGGHFRVSNISKVHVFGLSGEAREPCNKNPDNRRTRQSNPEPSCSKTVLTTAAYTQASAEFIKQEF